MPEFAVRQAVARTTVGTQDFTVTGFGTPVAAIFLISLATANDTPVSGSAIGMGFTDGTRNRSQCVSDQDNVATSVCRMKMSEVECITLIGNTGSLIGEARFSAWITDGVRINWPTTAPGAAYLISCILIGGAGVSNARVDTGTSPTTVDTENNITTVGFQPDCLLTLATDGNLNTSLSNSARFCFGFATSDNTQRSTQWFYTNGQNPSSGGYEISDTRIWKQPGASLSCELLSFDSQGFSAWTRGSSPGVNLNFFYLALKFNGLRTKIVNYDTPIVTGNYNVAGAGFTPQFLIHELTARQTTGIIQSADSEPFGIGAITQPGGAGDGECCVAITSDWVVTPINGENITDTHPVNLRKQAAAFQKESFTAFTNDGVQLNATTANGTLRKRFGLFVEASAPPQPPDTFVKLEIRAAP